MAKTGEVPVRQTVREGPHTGASGPARVWGTPLREPRAGNGAPGGGPLTANEYMFGWNRKSKPYPVFGAGLFLFSSCKEAEAMIRITLKDGTCREYAEPVAAGRVAADISPGLARTALAAEIDGNVRDLSKTTAP